MSTGKSRDPYADKYMGGDARLALTRKAMPWWYHALFAFIAAIEIVTALATRQYYLFGILPVVGLLWIMFTHARISVTESHVQVQLGIFGPKVPIAAIERITSEKYNVRNYGGWGIRFGRDGSTAYSVAGGNGMGVRIEFTDASGKKKAIFVSTDEPDVIVAAVDRARAARGVRISSPPAEAAPEEEEIAGEEKRGGRA